MKVTQTKLPGVLVFDPDCYGDERGYFMESYSAKRYAEAGLDAVFVQDNMSMSARGILRGLHLQHPHGQGKLVSVVLGEVYDVAVDVRVSSPTFGQWFGVVLSEANHRQMYIPPGFAHGFAVTSERALFTYKCTELYHPKSELGVAYNDPELGIDWPVSEPTISSKDAAYPNLADIDPNTLPQYQAEEAGGAG